MIILSMFYLNNSVKLIKQTIKLWIRAAKGDRRADEGKTTADIFVFLTYEPNGVVKEVYPKAMPVILTQPEETKLLLTAPWKEATHRFPSSIVVRWELNRFLSLAD